MTGLIELDDLKSSKLKAVMHSAGIDPAGASKKEEIISRLNEENVELTADGWTVDGEQFEVEEQVSKASDIHIAYGFWQGGATDERREEILELFEDTQYEIRTGQTETDKESVKIVLPAENDESE